MKLNMNKKYTTIAVYAFLVIAAAITFFFVISEHSVVGRMAGTFFGLMTPFIYGAALAYVLNPVLNWLEKKVFPKVFGDRVSKRSRRGLGVLLTFLFGCVALFLAVLIPQIVESIDNLAQSIYAFLPQAQNFLNDLIAQYGTNEMLVDVLSMLGVDISDPSMALQRLATRSYTFLTQVLPNLFGGVMRFTSGLLDVVVGIIIAIYLLWVVVRTLNMELLSTILGQLISVGAIALIIVFQPELRRFLQVIGMRQKHFNFITRIFSTGDDTVQTNVVPIVTACREMSETKTGALIVIGQQSDLRLIAEGGIALDAKVSTSLLKNIFFKNAPLHDGAVLIEGDRIVAAKCILPVTQSDVPKSYGTRHRAAIGMSEISDAIIIVVSEETGGISIAQGGELRRNIDPVRLQQTLQRYLTINTRKRSKKEVAE